MGPKKYLVQLYSLIVKGLLQKLRSPVLTIFELFLPSFFVLVLSISYWSSPTDEIQRIDYSYKDVFNFTPPLSKILCINRNSTLNVGLHKCSRKLESISCLTLIGNGSEVCYPTSRFHTINNLRYSLYKVKGPLAIPSLDFYLIQSALMTQLVKDDQRTLFEISPRVSLAHYGKLLVSSDNPSLAAQFMRFCKDRSNMCALVLHPTSFDSLKSAREYAVKNSGQVWSIVHLPSDTIHTNASKAEFTISMNFTATPSTRTLTNKVSVNEGLDTAHSPDVIYWASGFLTLQSFVQEFYIQRNIAKGLVSPHNVSYKCINGTDGTSCYMNLYGLSQVSMPTPYFTINDFMRTWMYFIPMVIAMSGLFMVSQFTSVIVEEKSLGTRESMLIMGMHPASVMVSWYICSLFTNIVAALFASFFMKVGLFQSVNFAVLIVLYFSFLNQNSVMCLLLSTIFFNPSVASWFSGFLVFLFTTVVYVIPSATPDFTKYMLSFLPCAGISESLFSISDYIQSHGYYSWSSMFSGGLSVGTCIGIMWASSGIMFMLAIYLDRVWPTEVGRREHPLFFLNFFRRFRGDVKPFPILNMDVCLSPQKAGNLTSDSCLQLPDTNHMRAERKIPLMEDPSEVLDPNDPDNVVTFHNLRKVYISGGLWGLIYWCFTGAYRPGDRCAALNGVSFCMKRGEVSVLLGTNGAGKSTLMKLATGVLRPTSGDVYIKGHSTTHENGWCRQHIGYCSQNDSLWASLTVEEHLTLYARLKLSTLEVQHYVDKAIGMIELEEKRYCQANTLSGGQRRRLCFAIALVADSEVLFLDEPTAGMDFETRKFVYDAIQRNRINASVLISTHILEEVDSLGDNILFMNDGRISAQGSLMFLKSCIKDSYSMTCVLENGIAIKDEEAAINNVIDFVRRNGYPSYQKLEGVNEGAHQKLNKPFKIQHHGGELCLSLPHDFLLSTGCEIYKELQKHKESLKLRHVGLNPPMMKDLFLFLINDQLEDGCNSLVTQQVSTVSNEEQEEERYKFESSNEFCVFARHFRTLFIKRLNFSRRDIKLLIIQIILPLVVILLSLLIELVPEPTQPSLRLDMTMFPDHATIPSQVFFGFQNSETPNAFGLTPYVENDAFGENYVGEFISNPASNLDIVRLLSERLMEVKKYNLPRIIALAPSTIKRPQNLPAATILFNASFQHSVPMAINSLYNLESDRLFGTTAPKIVARNSPMPLGHLQKKMVSSLKHLVSDTLITLPFLLIPVYIVGYIVRERETGAYHIQCLSGANAIAFWLSSFCFDLACYIITVAASFILFFVFDKKEFTSSNMLAPSLCLTLLYGLSSITVSYLIASFFKSPRKAQTSMLLINFSLGFLWSTLETILAKYSVELVRGLSSVVRLLPSAAFSEGIKVISFQELITMIAIKGAGNNMFGWTRIDEDGFMLGGIGTDLVYMCCIMVASIIAFSANEYTRIKRFNCQIYNCFFSKFEDSSDAEMCKIDPSVAAEAARVDKNPVGSKEDLIVVKNMRKHFPGMRRDALNNLTFGVHKGEVMCLLGPNGAGKTTTLKILAGEEVPSSGSAYINGVSIDRHASRSYLGYCPQYNPLLDNLSVKEHLWLFARLRHIREKCIKEEVSLVINEFGLYRHRHTAAHALSGGNKRRLSLAIAMIGHTTSILLDEPTANMDILGRLQVQMILKRFAGKRSVILATHLLDEIETLADRIVILKNGIMNCIGSFNELRNQYTKNEEYDVHITFPNNIDLLNQHAAVPEVIRDYFEALPIYPMDDDSLEGNLLFFLRVVSVQHSIIKLSIKCELFEIIKFMAQLHKNSIEGVPEIKYASISQKFIENMIFTKE